MPFDGIFEHNQTEKEADPEMIRLKSRIARDGREEYFQENGAFIIEK